jgi:hypothetical protein
MEFCIAFKGSHYRRKGKERQNAYIDLTVFDTPTIPLYVILKGFFHFPEMLNFSLIFISKLNGITGL